MRLTFLQWLRAFVGGLLPARDLPTPDRPVPDPTVPTPTPVPPSPAAVTGWRVNIVDALNAERAKAGLGPLRIDARLCAAAQQWAGSMAAAGRLGHSPTFGARITAAGYRWADAAENLAEGYPTPAAVVAAWMADGPHRANVLGPYAAVGVGVVGPYVCADFASPA